MVMLLDISIPKLTIGRASKSPWNFSRGSWKVLGACSLASGPHQSSQQRRLTLDIRLVSAYTTPAELFRLMNNKQTFFNVTPAHFSSSSYGHTLPQVLSLSAHSALRYTLRSSTPPLPSTYPHIYTKQRHLVTTAVRRKGARSHGLWRFRDDMSQERIASVLRCGSYESHFK